MDLESGNNIIISILQGTLTVLQIYEVHPCFVIQMFSQIFLWMASETFNRILKNEKKYLCRSKAVQIRMNLESISEWVRTSVLPPGVFGKHFEKVTQLLQVGVLIFFHQDVTSLCVYAVRNRRVVHQLLTTAKPGLFHSSLL